MDTSTVALVVLLILGFLYVHRARRVRPLGNARNMRLDVPETLDSTGAGDAAAEHGQSAAVSRPQHVPKEKRQVTEDMVEVVLAMAPNVGAETIRKDLHKTGSIETTMERILSGEVKPPQT